MSDKWQRIDPGTRDAIVITAARLIEMGFDDAPPGGFLVVILPRDENEVTGRTWAPDLTALCELMRVIEPHTLYTRTVGDDFDCDELAAVCRGRIPAPSAQVH